MFDGKLGTWKTYKLDFKLKEDANKISPIPYLVQTVHKESFKKEFEILVLLGVLEKANNSEWGSQSFTQSKPK